MEMLIDASLKKSPYFILFHLRNWIKIRGFLQLKSILTKNLNMPY